MEVEFDIIWYANVAYILMKNEHLKNKYAANISNNAIGLKSSV